MITVYAIKTKSGGYIGKNGRINVGRTDCFESTKSLDDAKHYESQSKVNSAIKNCSKRINERIAEIKAKLDNPPANTYAWHIDCWKRDLKDYKQIKLLYFPLTYVKHEVEDITNSNVVKIDKDAIKFNPWYYKSNIEIVTETVRKHYCKHCGVSLKNIPQVKITGIYSAWICVRCATAIGEQAKPYWDKMPNKDEIEKEIFLHSMDDHQKK